MDVLEADANGRVDRARHVPCNLCLDLCISRSTHNRSTSQRQHSTKKDDRPGAKEFLKYTPISPLMRGKRFAGVWSQ